MTRPCRQASEEDVGDFIRFKAQGTSLVGRVECADAHQGISQLSCLRRELWLVPETVRYVFLIQNRCV